MVRQLRGASFLILIFPHFLMDLSLVVVFVLASFVGIEVISKVPATLHTPLMSGSNAVSGITIVGALVVAGAVETPWAKWLGLRRARARDGQRRRRVRRHRPDAGDVQAARDGAGGAGGRRGWRSRCPAMSGALLDAGVRLAYLVAAGLFIVGLKRMSSPRTARAGNRLSAVGMLIAVVAALLSERILSPLELLVGLAIGSAIGLWLARKTEMTSMPELVAAFNGVGGAASALVAIAEVFRVQAEPGAPYGGVIAFTVGLSVLIGAVTLTGSFVAYGKLRGTLKRTGFPGLRFVSVALLGALIATLGLFVRTADAHGTQHVVLLVAIAALSCLIGVLLVLPIGGADMPVVVALLNAYSGLAAAATGFVLGNEALVVSGALVGASGVVLTQIMCRAMNRSLGNVLLGGFGATGAGPAQDSRRGAAGPHDHGGRRRDPDGLRRARRRRAGLWARRRAGAARGPRDGRPARRTRASTCATRFTRSRAACRAT